MPNPIFGRSIRSLYKKKTGRLIGGHQRIKHLNPDWEIKKDKNGAGLIITPFGNWTYREVSWPEKQEIATNIAANKHGGEFDFIKLKDLMVEIDDGSLDMEPTGFDEQELKDIFDYEGKKGLIEDDEVPEPKKAITKTGDLWLLGEHRLLCGDATKKEDVERLMDGKKADMVFTDPPYGINIVKGITATDSGSKAFGRVRPPGCRTLGVLGGDSGDRHKNLTGHGGKPGIVKPRLYYPVIGDDKPFEPAFLLGLSGTGSPRPGPR